MAKTGNFKVAKNVVWRNVEDEIVILNLDSGHYYSLDDVGARVWTMLAESQSPEKIAKRVAQEWDVDEQRASRDIAAFLSQIRKKKLIAAA